MKFVKRLAFLLPPLLLAGFAAWTGIHLHPSSKHPYLVLESDNNLKVTILQRGVDSLKACQALTSSLADALVVSCPTCRVLQATCLGDLNREQRRALSSASLTTPSAVIPNGVVIFDSPNPATASAVCEDSQRQSQNTANPSGRVFCMAPGQPRPRLDALTDSAADEVRGGWVAWTLISVLLLALYAYFALGRAVQNLSSRLVTLSRRFKQLLIASIDLLLIELTLWLAYVLRLGSVQFHEKSLFTLMIVAPILALPIFVAFGLYRSVIRYAGTRAMTSIARAVAVYIALAVSVIYLLPVPGTPRSVLVIHGALALLSLGASRFMARAWLNQLHPSNSFGADRRNVIIYGAGAAGVQLSLALSHSRELRPIAYLDDDARLHRTRLGDIEVFPPQRLSELIQRYQVREILLALPSASRHRRSEIVALLEHYPVQVRTLPMVSDLAEGKIKTDDLREVEIEDLLGRDPVIPDAHLLKANITGKSVMVTGAGGSIGSELCRQICSLRPASLVLFEQSEFLLYSLEQELAHHQSSGTVVPSTRIYPVLGSVADQARAERAIRKFNIETIYHAAAYKHVPLVEHNPCEGAFNNVVGTYRVARAALNQSVQTFVLISTDKAVRPTNTMGASKRFAELVLQALAADSSMGGTESRTRFTTVRFGNVLGSSGSVVPLFRKQIRNGGPLTVTDPRIVRYFMTIPEAAQLVLQAGAMGKNGDVFVLDMGEPVQILDLAKRMIKLSGLQEKSVENPNGDIEIVFTGLRPGEKLYEELLTGHNTSPTAHPRIKSATEKMLPLHTISQLLERLERAVEAGNSNETRTILLEAVEDFQPQCGNEDLILTRAPAWRAQLEVVAGANDRRTV